MGERNTMENIKRILITNDDGIDAKGLKRLAEAASKYGEVWVVAPDGQRSAASHSLTINDPLDVYPADWKMENVHAFSCTGLPADCVRIGSKYVMPEEPDVVFSGINNGFNAGADIQYSATVNAALDAALCGYPAIAFSEGFLNDPRSSGHGHKVTDEYLPSVLQALMDPDGAGAFAEEKINVLTAGQVINVNFPDCAPEECKGIKWNCRVSIDTPYIDYYTMDAELPGGGKRYTIHWIDRDHAEEGTDLRALLDKYVSVGIVNNIS